MSSLWKACVTINELIFLKIQKEPSPNQEKNNLRLARDVVPLLPAAILRLISVLSLKKGSDIKRISLFTFRKKRVKYLGGSMTVEAAAILPLLLFFFLNLTSVIEMIRLHGNLELALWESGRRLAVYGYLEQAEVQEEEGAAAKEWGLGDLAGVAVPNLYARSEVIRYTGREYLDQSPLTYGAAGLNFLESDFLNDEDCVDLTVTYQVSPMFRVPGFSAFRMGNRYYIRAWTGYNLASDIDEEQDYVYVTEYGTVYHETLECSYLKLTTRSVSLAEAYVIRNSKGEQYTLCWVCRDEKMGGCVYVTADGNRYHYSAVCPALKRIIHTINRSEAGKYRPCSRCASG